VPRATSGRTGRPISSRRCGVQLACSVPSITTIPAARGGRPTRSRRGRRRIWTRDPRPVSTTSCGHGTRLRGRPTTPGPSEHAADPLAAFEDLVGDTRPRFAPPTVHRVAVDRSLAGPLADLLDALADLAATTLAKRADDDVDLAGTEPFQSAMGVAERVCAAET